MISENSIWNLGHVEQTIIKFKGLNKACLSFPEQDPFTFFVNNRGNAKIKGERAILPKQCFLYAFISPV